MTRINKKKSHIHIGDVNGDVVISQDQSGGTTAHEITTATGKKHSKFVWIITAIFVVAAIAAILTYFDIKPTKENKMPKDEEEKISIGDVNGNVVISQNQTGGITAHNVNLKADSVNLNTDRRLDDETTKALVEGLKKNPCSMIVGVLGMGGEPEYLANQLYQAAKNAGCQVKGINHGIGFQAFSGLQIKF